MKNRFLKITLGLLALSLGLSAAVYSSFRRDLARGRVEGIVAGESLGNLRIRVQDTVEGNACEDKKHLSFAASASLRRIEINSVSADIEVGQSPDSQIQVHFSRHGKACATGDDVPQLKADLQGSALKVDLEEKNRNPLSKVSEARHIRILLPKSIQGLDWAVCTVAGDIQLTASGPVAKLTLKTVSGDIEFKGEAREINAVSVSGDTDLRLARQPEGLELQNVSGDTQVTLPGAPKARVEMSAVSGDLKSESSWNLPVQQDSLPGKSHLLLNPESKVGPWKIISVSGDIDLS